MMPATVFGRSTGEVMRNTLVLAMVAGLLAGCADSTPPPRYTVTTGTLTILTDTQTGSTWVASSEDGKPYWTPMLRR